MKRYIGCLLISVTLSSCVQLSPEECRHNNDNRNQTPPPQSVANTTDWLAFYLSSIHLTPEERRTRLLTLDALLNEGELLDNVELPKTEVLQLAAKDGADAIQDVRVDITTSTCYQNLQLQKATYLAGTPPGTSNWQQSINLLDRINTELPEEMRIYALWLRSELTTRLELAETATQLKKEKAILEIRIDRLQQKIEALTNIEQSLTEKKETQKSY